MYGGGTVAATQDGGHGDDRDVREEMLAIACVPGIRKRFKVGRDRADIDEFGHMRTSLHREPHPLREPTVTRAERI